MSSHENIPIGIAFYRLPHEVSVDSETGARVAHITEVPDWFHFAAGGAVDESKKTLEKLYMAEDDRDAKKLAYDSEKLNKHAWEGIESDRGYARERDMQIVIKGGEFGMANGLVAELKKSLPPLVRFMHALKR